MTNIKNPLPQLQCRRQISTPDVCTPEHQTTHLQIRRPSKNY